MSNAAPPTPPPPGDQDDDTDTPVHLDGGRRQPANPASPNRKAFGTLETAVHALAQRCSELRKEWDGASENHRRFLAEKAAAEFRFLSDVAFDLFRDLEQYARTGT